MASPDATKQLAEYIVGTNYTALSGKTVNAATVAFLDWAGCAVAGGESRSSQAAANVVRDEGASGQSLVFADGSRSSAHWAAFANGLASHTIELDDVHMESIIHGGVCVAPAALAVGEKLGVNGKRLIEGLVAGFDVTYRVGAAISKTHYERFHSTGTVGTLGAAAAAARLMGLSVEQTQWALGNAGSQAAALWQYLKVGDDTKVLHPGKAAMNGVLAASLARHGFTGIRRHHRGRARFREDDGRRGRLGRDAGRSWPRLPGGGERIQDPRLLSSWPCEHRPGDPYGDRARHPTRTSQAGGRRGSTRTPTRH